MEATLTVKGPYYRRDMGGFRVQGWGLHRGFWDLGSRAWDHIEDLHKLTS